MVLHGIMLSALEVGGSVASLFALSRGIVSFFRVLAALQPVLYTCRCVVPGEDLFVTCRGVSAEDSRLHIQGVVSDGDGRKHEKTPPQCVAA